MHPFETLIPNLTESQYNKLPGLRSTELKVAARSAMHWRHYTQNPTQQTDAMRFGAALHAAVLQPKIYMQNRRVMPDGNRTKEQKQARECFASQLTADSIVVTNQEHDVILRMVENVHNHPILGDVLAKGSAEQTVLWRDRQYDVDCKLRADLITNDGVVVDIKTAISAEVSEFTRQVVSAKYAYHVSVAHYLAGLVPAGLAIREFAFVVIEKAAPYAVALYRVPPDMIELGESIRGHAILNIKEAKKTGVYAGYSVDYVMLETPGWAKNVIDVDH